MKGTLFSVTLLLACGASLNEVLQAAPPPRVAKADRANSPPPALLQGSKFVLELKDGTRLIGDVAAEPRLGCEAEFGRFDLPLKLVKTVTFADEEDVSKIEFKNGDTLTAKVVLDSLPFATSYGTLKIPAQQLGSLTAQVEPEGPIVQTGGEQGKGSGVVPAAADAPPPAPPQEEEEVLVPDAARLDIPARDALLRRRL